MAIQTNTTKMISKASTALTAKCEATEKNMMALAKKAGAKGTKTTMMMIPLMPGEKDDVVYVGINGVDFYLRKGKTLNLPDAVLEVLQNTGVLPKPEKIEAEK